MAKYSCPVCQNPSEHEDGCFKHRPRKGLSKGTRLKPRKKSEEEKEANRLETEKMWAFYQYLWKKKEDKRCENCNIPIWGENLSVYHDHLLEKSTYEHLKYEEDNMFFCCWACHHKKGMGFPGEKHKAAIDKAKERFNII